MKNIHTQTSFEYFMKLTIAIVSSIVLIFCSARVVLAIQFNTITVSSTTGDITVVDNQFSGTTISPTLVFNTVGDSITYNIPLSSPDGTEYKINSVTDDNNNPYITTTYSYSNDINADDKSIQATMTYANTLPENGTLSLDDIHMSITIEENSGSQDPDDPTPVDPDDPTPDDPDDPVDPDNPTPAPIEPVTPDNPTPDNPTPSNSGSSSKSNSTISVPNTGKYFQQNSNSQSDNILPFLILGFLSIISLIITILPKKSRIKFGTPIILLSFSVISLALPHNTYADTTNYNFTILGANVSAVPEVVIPPQDTVSFYFPNIYNNPDLLDDVDLDDTSTFGNGNAIIMQTLDNKYVLLDTGAAIKNTKSIIYNKLKELQNKTEVTIDYFIISHLDGDHYGNASAILNDNNITVHNIVIKHEQYADADMTRTRGGAFKNIIKSAANNNVHIITSASARSIIESETSVTDFDRISEGMVIPIGEYLKLNFFNTANVYDNKECIAGDTVLWKATRNSNLPFKTPNGEYVYFDGSEYPNITLRTSTEFKIKENGSGINRYFYAIDKNNDLTPLESSNICRSNPNSFGILAEAAIGNNKTKYAYFPNDMENAGYDIRQSGSNSARIFENLAFDSNTGDFKTDITPYTIPSEINTANKIYTKLSNDASAKGTTVNDLLNNIDIYQMSHHGINNNEEAINKLNLNRNNGIYAIQESHSALENHNNWAATKTYNYTLKNIPAERKMRVGTEDKQGVKCTFNTVNATSCLFY